MSAAYQGTERRALPRGEQAHAGSYVGTTGARVYGAFTASGAWRYTNSLTEARHQARIHNLLNGHDTREDY